MSLCNLLHVFAFGYCLHCGTIPLRFLSFVLLFLFLYRHGFILIISEAFFNTGSIQNFLKAGTNLPTQSGYLHLTELIQIEGVGNTPPMLFYDV